MKFARGTRLGSPGLTSQSSPECDLAAMNEERFTTLMKPFNLGQLSQVVKAALARNG
jgi:DNA-binding NtrC family response regulator